MKKRLLFIFITVILLISASVFCFAAAPAEEVLTDSTGTYQYTSYFGSWARLDKVLTQPDADFVIPETVDGIKVESLGNDIFKVDGDTDYSESIVTVTVSDSLRSWNIGAFRNCPNVEKFIVSDTNTVFTTDEYGILFDKEMTRIREVPNNINITEYVIPSTVTSFYSGFFPPQIETLTIPESVTDFGMDAVKHNNQNKVKNLIIENFRADWPDSVFYEWSSIETVTLGKKSEVISAEAFRGCGRLKEIKGGENIKKIGDDAFYNCGNLTTAIFENVEEIGEYAFFFCKKLTVVPYGDKLKKMGKDAFSSCYGLESVTIPASLSVVPELAFWNCDALKELNVEYGCTQIDKQAFYSCKLTDIMISGSVKTIGDEAFKFQTGGQMTITLEEGVENIGAEAFACFNEYFYTSFSLPKSIKTIGENAFDNHRCSSFTVPEGCKSIAKGAFDSDKISGTFTLTVLSPDCVIDDEGVFQGNSCFNALYYAYPGSTAEEHVKSHPTYVAYTMTSGGARYGTNTFVSLCDEGRHVPGETCSIYTRCKYCGMEMMTHTDENNDDICDVCGKFCGKIDVEYINGILRIFGDCDNIDAYKEFAPYTKTLILDKGVTKVLSGQFDGFDSLRMIYISDTVESIEDSAFYDCEELSTVIFASDSTVLGENVFGSEINMYIPNTSDFNVEDANIIKYTFDNSTLYLNGFLRADMYTYLDTVSIFTLMFDDIKNVYIDRFEAVGFTIYTYNKENDSFKRADKFDEVTFSVMVEAPDGERKQVSYNDLGEYLDDGKGTFYIITDTADGNDHKDTKVSVVDRINQTISRILAAIVKLLNKIFLFFSKFK